MPGDWVSTRMWDTGTGKHDDRSDGVVRCWQVERDRGRRPHLAYLAKPNLLSVLTRGRLSFGPIRTQEGQSIGRRKQGGDEERG